MIAPKYDMHHVHKAQGQRPTARSQARAANPPAQLAADLHVDTAPGEDGCHQPGRHAIGWLVGGFASVIVPGFIGMLVGLL